MNKVIDNILNHSYRMLGAMALVVIAQTPAFAAETEVKPYQMGVLLNKAYGRTIDAGKYEKAVAKMAHRLDDSSTGFGMKNNLCVAFVKTHNLDEAATACDAAVAEASKLEKSALSGKKRHQSEAAESHRADLAIALLNRGVLLAVQGNTDKAQKDFESAASLGSRHTKLAAENLQRLQHSIPGDA